MPGPGKPQRRRAASSLPAALRLTDLAARQLDRPHSEETAPLALSRDLHVSPPSSPCESIVASETELRLKGALSSGSPSGSRSDTCHMNGEPVRVALVEDEVSVRDSVERALIREGVTVSSFADYVEPDEILAAAPHLIVLDVMLPSGDGFDRTSHPLTQGAADRLPHSTRLGRRSPPRVRARRR